MKEQPKTNHPTSSPSLPSPLSNESTMCPSSACVTRTSNVEREAGIAVVERELVAAVERELGS